MKFLLASLFILSTAQAAEKLIYEGPTDFWTRESKVEFAINREMGRAWVSLLNYSGQSRNDRYVNEVKIKVEGMSFEESMGAIMLDNMECATVVRRGMGPFRFDQITPSGCRLKLKKAKKIMDDGYNRYKIDVTQVYLITE